LVGISDHENTEGNDGVGFRCDVVAGGAMAGGDKTSGHHTTYQTESDDAHRVHAAASVFG